MKTQLAKLSAIAITAVLVAILLSQISIGDVAETLASIEPIYLVIVFIISNKKQRREDFEIISYGNDEKLDGNLFEYSGESYIIDKSKIKKYRS